MDLSSYTIKNLKTKCKDLGIKNYSNKNKTDLINLILTKTYIEDLHEGILSQIISINFD